MEYYLGIDQGGTKSCVAVCAEDGAIIASETGMGSVLYLDDPDNISSRIALSLANKALAGTGISMADMTAVCAGLSGADWGFEYPILERRMREALEIADITVLNDCIIAMRAGSAAPNRAVICAGTEINIAVRAGGGKEIIFGYYISPRLRGALAIGGMVMEAVTDSAAGVKAPTALT
ncbi:MAG: hypothetical protein FWF44_05515, partial [Defluviitaleaceae bacterium]|nr:hypothetical protein [Defluviitaleaceae bacterium]